MKIRGTQQPISQVQSQVQSPLFTTTHWTMILEAGENVSPKASEALAELCRAYWYPLYAFVRRKGYQPQDAQDLTQEFFARLLARNYLGQVDRNKGKFRSFLLAALEHFLAKEWRRSQAQKRGSGQTPLSLDAVDAEDRYLLEPADEPDAEKIFDRRWANTLLDLTMTRLRKECEAEGKGVFFKTTECLLSLDTATESYRDMAGSLGMSEGAFKMAVHRLRQRFGELLRAEIAQTAATPEEANEELHYFIALLRE